MTKAGISFVLCALLGACGVGDEGDDGVTPTDPNPLRLQCSAGITITGTFTESVTNPRPPDVNDPTQLQGGCWPVGTWNFTAAVDPAADVLDITGDGVGDRCGEVAGTTAPTFESSYSFSVDRVDDPANDGIVETYQYIGTSPNFVSIKVSEGGGGDCEGIMEFKSTDSKSWWVFNPVICTSAGCVSPSNTISGKGDFTVYLDPNLGQ